MRAPHATTVCIFVPTDWDERVPGYATSWWEMATPQVSRCRPSARPARSSTATRARQRYLMIPGAPYQQPSGEHGE